MQKRDFYRDLKHSLGFERVEGLRVYRNTDFNGHCCNLFIFKESPIPNENPKNVVTVNISRDIVKFDTYTDGKHESQVENWQNAYKPNMIVLCKEKVLDLVK